MVLKSRVHFWRGFVEDGFAKTVVVVDAPGLGSADVTTIPCKHAPEDLYPLAKKQAAAPGSGGAIVAVVWRDWLL